MSFSVRPYQHQAAEWLSRRKRGLLSAPAGSGKSLTLAYALDMAVKSRVRGRKVKIGWLCNTREQAAQAQKAMDAFPLVAKQDIRIACAAAATDWSDRDVLVTDECHHAGSAQGWQSQIQTCKGALWAMTATIPETQFRELFCLRYSVSLMLSPASTSRTISLPQSSVGLMPQTPA